LDAAAALLNPYNHCKLASEEPYYPHLQVGDVPSKDVLDDLMDGWEAFLDRYVKDLTQRTLLREQMDNFLRKDPVHFRPDAFDPQVRLGRLPPPGPRPEPARTRAEALT